MRISLSPGSETRDKIIAGTLLFGWSGILKYCEINEITNLILIKQKTIHIHFVKLFMYQT